MSNPPGPDPPGPGNGRTISLERTEGTPVSSIPDDRTSRQVPESSDEWETSDSEASLEKDSDVDDLWDPADFVDDESILLGAGGAAPRDARQYDSQGRPLSAARARVERRAASPRGDPRGDPRIHAELARLGWGRGGPRGGPQGGHRVERRATSPRGDRGRLGHLQSEYESLLLNGRQSSESDMEYKSSDYDSDVYFPMEPMEPMEPDIPPPAPPRPTVEAPDEKCSICYEKLTNNASVHVVRLACGHVFCSTCIRRWQTTARGKFCPLCRRPATTMFDDGILRLRL